MGLLETVPNLRVIHITAHQVSPTLIFKLTAWILLSIIFACLLSLTKITHLMTGDWVNFVYKEGRGEIDVGVGVLQEKTL